jgi:hypothetical protein
MTYLAIQYLEHSSEIASITPQQARARLRVALQALPISDVLIGWNVPDAILNACAEETASADARFCRWHPLLTGDGALVPRPEWQTVGLDGDRVPGFQDMPEFTFLCPNRSQVQEATLEHIHDLLREQRYHGFFLDRIRYPSPAPDPSRFLACFCEDCHRAAREHGLDLLQVQRQIQSLLTRPKSTHSLVHELLGHSSAEEPGEAASALRAFLRFRAKSVSRFVGTVAHAIHAEGLEVGLDCFSPALTWMVGQDLSALNAHCEWVKTMSYGHTMGPAGLPFELLSLAGWLVNTCNLSEAQALDWLSEASGLHLPRTRKTLLEQGLTPQALGDETRRARAAGVRNLLAGIELVDLEGITQLNETQIAADLHAFRSAGADGLVLSWDLWHIPLERLKQVRQVWAHHLTSNPNRDMMEHNMMG